MLKMKNNKHCNKRIGMLVPFVFILCLCFVNKHIHAELNEHDEVDKLSGYSKGEA